MFDFDYTLLNQQVIFEMGNEQHLDVVQDGDRFVLRLRSPLFTVDYGKIEGPECSLRHGIPFHEFRKLVTALSTALKKLDASHQKRKRKKR